MALSTKYVGEIGILFGDAHECFENSLNSQMDRFYNNVGYNIGNQYDYLSDEDIANIVKQALDNGSLCYIKQDGNNWYLIPTNQ